MSEEISSTIKTHVPDKGIAEITLRNLDRYDEAQLLAKTGVPSDPQYMPRNYNEKVENRFEGLRNMYAYQQNIISGHIKGLIKSNCLNNWKRKYKKEEERERNPFDKEDNSYNLLGEISDFLDECEQQVEESIITRTPDDDFIKTTDLYDGSKRKQLTKRFFYVYKMLVNSYEEITRILSDNKIITLGSNDDEDRTEEEREEELRRRVLES